MKIQRNYFLATVLSVLPLMAAADSRKDADGHERQAGYQEFKEKYRDGNCKVEREGKKDGEYKEKRECKSPRHGSYSYSSPDSLRGEHSHAKWHGREFKEEYFDGNCKVEREVKKDGEYKEKRECNAPQHGYYAPAPVYVPAPSKVIVEPGITVHGNIRIP